MGASIPAAASPFAHPRRIRAAALLACALSAVPGCSAPAPAPSEAPPPPAPADAGAATPPEQPEGHRRMLELLRQIDEQARAENPFLGLRLIPKMRADLEQTTEAEVPKRWLLNVLLGQHELRLGHEDRAIEHYEEAQRLLALGSSPVPREHFVRSKFEMGVAYMRVAETRNCVQDQTAMSCIFPIDADSVHRFPEAAHQAIDAFHEVLEVVDRGSREYVRARWLLNIAYMTVGEYPAGVPAEYLIPQERLASDEEFPRFTNIAPVLGIDDFDLAGGAIGEDFDRDGDIDILTTTMDTAGQMRLWRNDGDGTFTDRTVAAGLLGLTGGLNATQADYDGDGWIDVLVLRGAWWRQLGRHPRSLLHNNGDGTFTDVTFEAGLGDLYYPTQAASWADYDLDGDLDLYIGNESGKALRFDDAEDAEAVYPCQLFRNRGDGTFEDVAAAAGVLNLGYTKGVVWGDYDADRWPDLYVSNGGQPNRLYRNRGDGTFEDVAPALGLERPIAGFAVWFWDPNNDGGLDLYAAAYGGARQPPDVADVAAGYMGLQPNGESSALYIADGRGGFVESAKAWGIDRISLPMGSNFGDLDNDGYPDFYLGTGYPYYEGLVPNVMYRNRGGRSFADVTTAGGFGHLQKGHGVVFADFDLDGDQDVFESIGGAFPGDAYANVLFENPGFGRHWIKISLVGQRSNRHGVLSRIRIDIVERGVPRTIYHWVTSGGSFGANPLRREIGLGAAGRIERLEVHWPASDLTQTFRDVPGDRWIEITEGEPAYRERELPH